MANVQVIYCESRNSDVNFNSKIDETFSMFGFLTSVLKNVVLINISIGLMTNNAKIVISSIKTRTAIQLKCRDQLSSHE